MKCTNEITYVTKYTGRISIIFVVFWFYNWDFVCYEKCIVFLGINKIK